MTTLTEAARTGEFIASEAPGTRSREQIIVGSGANIVAGHVLGATETSTATVTPGTPVSGSGGTVGNGSIGTVTADAGAPAGTWKVRITAEATNAGAFTVYKPDGSEDGVGTVAVAYNGTINFTLADGSNDWKEDDYIPIVVQYVTPALKYKKLAPAATDGTQNAAGILYRAADALSADRRSVAVVRAAEVNGDLLTWPSGITTAQKAAAVAQLAVLGINIR